MAEMTMDASGHAHDATEITKKNNNMKLAMWLYLASEIVIFSIFIAGYSIYRLNQPAAVSNIHDVLGIALVTANTFLLLTSSWCMVMGLRAIEMGNRASFMRWIGLTAFLGAIFLGGQWIEYRELAHLNLTLQRSDLSLQDEVFANAVEIEEVASGTQVNVFNTSILDGLNLSYEADFSQPVILNESEYAEFEEQLTDNFVAATANFGMRFYAPTAFHGAHVLIGVLLALHVLWLGSRGFYDNNPIGVEMFGLYWHFVDVVWILLFTLIYLV